MWIILLLISLLVFAFSAFYIVNYFFGKGEGEIALPSVDDTVSEVTPVKNEVKVPVDFKKLQKINKDIYAWIKIPGTEVDYPILQSGEGEDRSFYLDHNVNREYSVYGAIYTQNYNSKDFNDYNTVIYGHDMKNGSMFGSLKKYRDKTFFDKYNTIYVYMPGRILKYRVFGAYVFDDRHILMSFNFNEEDERELYLDAVYSHRDLYSNFSDDTVDVDDKIITLSTCYGNYKDKRYLVQGVLMYDSDQQP